MGRAHPSGDRVAAGSPMAGVRGWLVAWPHGVPVGRGGYRGQDERCQWVGVMLGSRVRGGCGVPVGQGGSGIQGEWFLWGFCGVPVGQGSFGMQDEWFLWGFCGVAVGQG